MNVTAYKFLRKVFALPFLLADHIPPAFEKLKEKATDEKTQEVMQYIEDTWMTSTVRSKALLTKCTIFHKNHYVFHIRMYNI
jgi:hypothetical protein